MKIIGVVVKPKFKIGDRVRILKKKKTFEKGFHPPKLDRRIVHCEWCETIQNPSPIILRIS